MAGHIDFNAFVTSDSLVELTSADKWEALEEMCDRLVRHPHVDAADGGRAVREALVAREQLVSTGIGIGVAVPHVKIPQVEDYVVVIGRHRAGLEFDALDGEPVHLIFMLAAAERQAGEFVRLLASVVRFVRQEEVRQRLLEAEIPEGVLALLREGV